LQSALENTNPTENPHQISSTQGQVALIKTICSEEFFLELEKKLNAK